MLLNTEQFAAACGPAVTVGMVRYWIQNGWIVARQAGALSPDGRRSRYLIDDAQIAGLFPELTKQSRRETKAERKARDAGYRAEIAAM